MRDDALERQQRAPRRAPAFVTVERRLEPGARRGRGMTVLDASAVLALIHDEPCGAARPSVRDASSSHWTARLDLVHRMRQSLNGVYRVKIRDEVKGEWLAGVKKQFRELGLGDGQQRDIYQRHLRMLDIVSSGAFAVVIRKGQIVKRETDPELTAWEHLLQRLRIRSNGTGAPIVVVHDQTSK